MYLAPSNWRLDSPPDDSPAQPTNDAMTRRMEAAGYEWDGEVWSRVISARVRTSRAGPRYLERVTRYIAEDGTARVIRTKSA